MHGMGGEVQGSWGVVFIGEKWGDKAKWGGYQVKKKLIINKIK
jgi:hypothetical protein